MTAVPPCLRLDCLSPTRPQHSSPTSHGGKSARPREPARCLHRATHHQRPRKRKQSTRSDISADSLGVKQRHHQSSVFETTKVADCRWGFDTTSRIWKGRGRFLGGTLFSASRSHLACRPHLLIPSFIADLRPRSARAALHSSLTRKLCQASIVTSSLVARRRSPIPCRSPLPSSTFTHYHM
jgi:hypothetical protein